MIRHSKEIKGGCLFQPAFNQHIKTGFWEEVTQTLIETHPELTHQWQKVHHYYLPLFFWIWEGIDSNSNTSSFIGINGANGIGKSTLSRILVSLLKAYGVNAATASIDDFYLTHQAQVKLADRYPNIPLLHQRGYPGTHDHTLAYETLTALKSQKIGQLRLPRFDKSANQGEGERLEEERWDPIQLPIQVLLLEGWMVGFPEREDVDNLSKEFQQLNTFLGNYKPFFSLIDRFIYLQASQVDFTLSWRVEAEEMRVNLTKRGLSLSKAKAFSSKFIPGHQCWVPGLIQSLPGFSDYLHCEINKDRQPIRLISRT